MKPRQLLLSSVVSLMIVAAGGCKDDHEEWRVSDGIPPVLTMESIRLGSRPGSTFHIKGHIDDADGISTISLKCPSLFLDKTIDIIKIYGEPLSSYDLDYGIELSSKEAGDLFKILVTVTDVAGKTVSQEVSVDLNGDVDAPVFSIAPEENSIVVMTDRAILPINFTVTDDRALEYVDINIESIGYHKNITSFENPMEYQCRESVELPVKEADYVMTVTACDTWGNSTEKISNIKVSQTADYPKMWLADVKTAEELNSDVMGVPMLIDRIAPYKYEARYYNEKKGTEVWFLPQRNDFTPVRFGRDASDAGKISSADGAVPFVLDQEKVYYLFNLDILNKTVEVSTYSVTEAVDPVPHPFGSNLLDVKENGETFGEFWFGYMTSNPSEVSRFKQDPDNPHRYWLEQPLSLKGGRHSGFIIHNYHPEGWWNYCTWRADNEQDPEKAEYYGNYTNPQWKGERAKDLWFKPAVPADGNYRLYFDAHLGRMKIVRVQ